MSSGAVRRTSQSRMRDLTISSPYQPDEPRLCPYACYVIGAGIRIRIRCAAQSSERSRTDRRIAARVCIEIRAEALVRGGSGFGGARPAEARGRGAHLSVSGGARPARLPGSCHVGERKSDVARASFAGKPSSVVKIARCL
uniref:Uncharacterized protein n=1 Tax=Oryza sativa subsp. japonica TaxID=39947 RepID=Q84MP0_ORYSJ|nr:hypothetical protein [Oryza sativa Japonica Group]